VIDMRYALILIVLILASFAPVASAEGAVCIVESYEVNPSVFMTNDLGTIRFTIKNTAPAGTGMSAEIERVDLFGNGIEILTNGLMHVGEIGPQDTIDFTFKIQAKRPEGTYYPKLLVEFGNGKTIRYTVPIEVENTAVEVTASSIPDDMRIGETSEIKLTIANRRANTIHGIKIHLASSGATSAPSSHFISSIEPNGVEEISFNITPSTDTEAFLFETSYKNGENYHEGDLKVQVDLKEGVLNRIILTGIEFDSNSRGHAIAGEINNAGEEDLEGVMIAFDETSEVIPVLPYKSYFIGSIEKDDFASFELNFKINEDETANATEIIIPLLIEYRDLDGDRYQTVEEVVFDLGQRQNPEDKSIPSWLFAVVIVLVLAVVGMAIGYSWKR